MSAVPGQPSVMHIRYFLRGVLYVIVTPPIRLFQEITGLISAKS